MGPALCLVSAACFGAMAIFGKLAYDAGVTPEALLLVRFTLSAVLLGTVLVCRRSERQAVRGRLLVTALGLGAVGYAAQASLYFAALERMDASLLSLILYTFPVMVTVAAALLGRDRLTPPRIVALTAASAGTVLVLLGAGTGRVQADGALLGFGAALTYTVYILVADTVVRRLTPVLLAVLVMTGAAATLGARAAFTGGVSFRLPPSAWLWLACTAVISTVIAMLTFFAGLKRTGPSTAAILSTFEPVVTTALAALTLGESLTPIQLLGGTLVLSCVVVLQITTRTRWRRYVESPPSPVETPPLPQRR
ncbi:DMT family transporter [Actinoplanes sp. NPDC020271]|uniref:DMT family transporter n=1 Tax=Actinoplanes sp. NPDC020271 TaxID=3363896 RepID=UPI0037A4B46B